jgi:hypothetical protein
MTTPTQGDGGDDVSAGRTTDEELRCSPHKPGWDTVRISSRLGKFWDRSPSGGLSAADR